MDTTKICLLGYIVLTVVHMSLSHPLERHTRTGNTSELLGNSSGSTELVERCTKIDEKSLIILCRTHCKINISQEYTTITQIDYETWMTSEESFTNNLNRCICCKTKMELSEKTTNEAIAIETATDPLLVLTDLTLSNTNRNREIVCLTTDNYNRRNWFRELHNFVPGVLFLVIILIIVGVLLGCLANCCRRGESVMITRRISVSNDPSVDSIKDAVIVSRSQMKLNKDNPPSYDDIVLKSFASSDSLPSYQQINGAPQQV